jgi:DNA invertase Pin-like site-specific DNA recombinase
MSKPKRVAIYVRVSTDTQTTDTQRQELEAWAERAGHTVVRVYEDQGVSGAKGRDQRPQFDALLKAAIRRDFNMIAVWSSDRLGRSLRHLVEVLEIRTPLRSAIGWSRRAGANNPSTLLGA